MCTKYEKTEDFVRNCLISTDHEYLRCHTSFEDQTKLCSWMTPCYHKNTLFWVEQQTQVAMSFSGFLMDASPPQHPNLRPSCHHGWGWRHPLLSSPTNLNHFQGPAHLQLADKGDLDKVALHLETISGVMLAPFSRDKLIFNGRWSFCWDCKAFFSQWRSLTFPPLGDHFPQEEKTWENSSSIISQSEV